MPNNNGTPGQSLDEFQITTFSLHQHDWSQHPVHSMNLFESPDHRTSFRPTSTLDTGKIVTWASLDSISPVQLPLYMNQFGAVDQFIPQSERVYKAYELSQSMRTRHSIAGRKLPPLGIDLPAVIYAFPEPCGECAAEQLPCGDFYFKPAQEGNRFRKMVVLRCCPPCLSRDKPCSFSDASINEIYFKYMWSNGCAKWSFSIDRIGVGKITRKYRDVEAYEASTVRYISEVGEPLATAPSSLPTPHRTPVGLPSNSSNGPRSASQVAVPPSSPSSPRRTSRDSPALPAVERLISSYRSYLAAHTEVTTADLERAKSDCIQADLDFDRQSRTLEVRKLDFERRIEQEKQDFQRDIQSAETQITRGKEENARRHAAVNGLLRIRADEQSKFHGSDPSVPIAGPSRVPLERSPEIGVRDNRRHRKRQRVPSYSSDSS